MEREDIIQLARENGLRFDPESGYVRLTTPNDRWEVVRADRGEWVVIDRQGHTPRVDVSGVIEAQEHIDRIIFTEEN